MPLEWFDRAGNSHFPADVDPFHKIGVPAATTFCNSKYYHTVADTPERLRAECLGSLEDVLVRLILAVQGVNHADPRLPSLAGRSYQPDQVGLSRLRHASSGPRGAGGKRGVLCRRLPARNDRRPDFVERQRSSCRFRRKSPVNVTEPPPRCDYRWLYQIDVTNDCNLRCPVCLNPRREGEPITHLSRQQVKDLAGLVRHGGRKAVVLTGGEPTLHPDLPGIVRTLAASGFRVGLATNGQRIAEDRDCILRLRRAGVSMIWLQMDTLDENVQQIMRGNRHVGLKIRAAERVCMRRRPPRLHHDRDLSNLKHDRRAAGILDSLVPALSLLNIHVAAPFGRFELPHDALVDREQVIEAILHGGPLRGRISSNNFWPQPVFSPWQAAVHPDCSASLVLLVDGEWVHPLDDFMDLNGLYRRLAAAAMPANFYTRNVVPLRYALGAAAAGQHARLLSHLWGLVRRRGKRGLLVIAVNALMKRDCQDEQRLRRCSSCALSPSGTRPGCLSCWVKEKGLPQPGANRHDVS